MLPKQADMNMCEMVKKYDFCQIGILEMCVESSYDACICTEMKSLMHLDVFCAWNDPLGHYMSI